MRNMIDSSLCYFLCIYNGCGLNLSFGFKNFQTSLIISFHCLIIDLHYHNVKQNWFEKF